MRAAHRIAWIFCAPALCVTLGIAGWPLLRTVLISLTDARAAQTHAAAFVGVANYALVLTDPEWWTAVKNTLLFASVSVGCETALGVCVALLMNAPLPFRGLLRAIVLMPWAVPTVVSGRLWAWMFNDLNGIVNALGLRLGLLESSKAWLADDTLAFWVIVLVDVWKSTPFMALLSLAGLQLIPANVLDAARIDGATPMQSFFRITLPLLTPTLVVAVIFRSLDALRVFDLVYVLTGSGRAQQTVTVYAHRELVSFQEFGTGAAASTLTMFLIALVTIVLLGGARRLVPSQEGSP